MKYGKLTVIEDGGRNRHGHRLLLCLCDCGTSKVIVEQSLKSGMTKSCGCHRVEVARRKNFKHGARQTKAFEAWWNMKSRCERPNGRYFKDYGGRGIQICERWLDFANFYEDMGEPEATLTLDRIDNNLGYFKENVRWATRQEQANNRRSNRMIEHSGKTMTLMQWARETGIGRSTIAYRIDNGWPIDKALSTSS